MLRELTIKNYKSILDHTIELGRINVFIGENGCGKTNILEAVAMAAAAVTNKLTVEDLFNRGMRVARPALIRSSFPGATGKEIEIGWGVEVDETQRTSRVDVKLVGVEAPVKWNVVRSKLSVEPGFNPALEKREERLRAFLQQSTRQTGRRATERIPNERLKAATDREIARLVQELLELGRLHEEALGHSESGHILEGYGIYDANSLSLRGLATVSRRAPLGLYGETLDDAIFTLDKASLKDLQQRARRISWLEKFAVDTKGTDQYAAHKLGASQSKLFFHDKHMRRKNNIFSAENANEGILHVLFHLTLFMHPDTPRVLGIDNIETALNPQLCRDLMAQLPELAEKHGKQALITTHNPAILDGLNLHDDEQRLFVVARDDEGHTVAKRIKQKEQPKDAPFKHKLSELWMRGHLGGLPETF